MKKVVVVAKYFYPLVNTRSQQAQLFVEALAEFSEVVVITAGYDVSEYQKNNVTVYPVGAELSLSKYGIGRISRYKRRIAKEWSVTTGYGWALLASKLLFKLIGSGWTNVITMSEPFDSHYVALYLRKKLKFRWFAFFSDPWPYSIMPSPYSLSSIPVLSIVQERQCRRVLCKSDNIIFTNSLVSRYISNKLNIDICEKSLVIRHLRAKEVVSANFKNNDIVHLGHLSKERVSKRFFSIFFQCMLKYSLFDRLVLVGRVCPEMVLLVKELNMENYVEFKGEVSQIECQGIASSARALLLVEAEMSYSPFVPSKLAEYFSLGIPILALTNRGSETADLLHRFGNGVACFHGQDDIDKVLLGVRDLNVSGHVVDKASKCFSFSQIKEVLDSLL